MRLLIIADVHGEFEKLGKLLDKIKEGFDAVLCPGDFTDMQNTPKDFTQIDIADIVLQKLVSLKKPVLCVPGNHDPYEIVDLFEEYGVNLHGKHMKIGETSFVGFGGAQTPFNTPFEPTDEEIKSGLAGALTKAKGQTIMMVHWPAYGTKLDEVGQSKHAGSKVIREIIEQKKPALCISAHIHENHGKDVLAGCTLFYPGPAYEGRYGIAEIEGNKVTCKALKETLG